MKTNLENGQSGLEHCFFCSSPNIDYTRACTMDGYDLLDVWDKKPYFYAWCLDCDAKWSVDEKGMVFGCTEPKRNEVVTDLWDFLE